ncbi:MAG: TIGR01777 family oxidoreductase [Dehalococcoidia bacterium]
MRVAITGASGFIGRALAQSLREDGHLPLALSHDIERAARALPGVETLDINDAITAWPDVDAVVNLMGEPVNGRWTSEKKRAIYDSRVIGTRKLAEAIGRADRRPNCFVNASAVGYYGDRGEEFLTESSLPGQAFLSHVCAHWEGEARRVGDLGVRWAVVRTGVVLGDGGALDVLKRLFMVGLGGPLGSGRQWFPWITRADIVRLYRFVLESDHQGVFLAATPEPVRQKEFASVLGKALGRPAVLPAPGFAVRLAAGEFASEVLDSRRCVPRETIAAGFEFEHPHLPAALRSALGEGQSAQNRR